MKISVTIIRNFLAFLFLAIALPVIGQEDFNAAKINPQLLAEANAVIRLEETNWEIISKAEARLRSRLVVTVLNEKGEEEHGQLMVGYDKFTKVSEIEGNLYDAAGKLIRKLKNSDIEDYGYGGSGDDITDARVRLADFGKKSYPFPYTIEYSYQTRDRNMMFYPRWIPASDSKTAVEHSVYTVKSPAGTRFRYKEYNGAPAVTKSVASDGVETFTWKMDNRPASKPDLYPLHPLDNLPMVFTAPSDFEVQDYKGNFNSWEDLSRFYYTLNAGRDVLPVAMVAEIKSIIKDAKNDKEKVLLIYNWMQKRSRYVSIQLGIGGWQTIDANTVAMKGYGDCKALTNFTLAALRQVGITCYAALIKAGEEAKIKSDFPSSQFNHVIACAIVAKDTMWLECTSQTTKANFMGTFTGGRHALLVMPEGGKLVATPDYKSKDNIRKSRSNVKLEMDGNGQIEVHTLYTGLQHETRQSIIHNHSSEQQKKWLINHINLPSLDLQRFELTEGKESESSVTEKLSMNVRNCATKTGTRLFVKTSLLSRSFELPAFTERTNDFYLPFSDYDFTDVDTIAYTIPAGYKLETSLPAVQIHSVFGTFESKTTYENNLLLCSRRVVLNGGRYKANEYAGWIDFLKKARKADRAQVVFVENK